MAGRYYIKTFGCQMNEYDSSRMVDVLGEHRPWKSPTPAEADVILLNTCSMREKAQDKVYSLLGRWRELKLAKPDMVIAVGGCVASQEGEAIRKRAPYVDVVFGPQTLHRLPEMIDELKRTGRAVIDVSFPEIEKFDHLPEPRVEGPSALCVGHGRLQQVLHLLRGAVHPRRRSQPLLRRLARRSASLAENGVREVTLLGQNVNGYRGRDGRRHGGGPGDT